jgi:methylmalonyl-CoA/ethylmalonyl-CoA epimerase
MKILRIDHVALAVPNLEPSIHLWSDLLGLSLGAREIVSGQLAEVAFLRTAAEAEACVELITSHPVGQNIGVEKFLERTPERRGGVHHIAFEVDDLQAALDELFARGVPLIDRVPRPGARGHEVAFLHPRALSGVLVELVAPAKHSAQH